jgi:hypothetical protein
MAYFFPEGSKFYYSNTLATAKNLTAVTNASPAVATSVAHGFVDLDPLLITSGWEDATDTIFEADQLTVDTFAITGLDSTDTNWFAAGTGTGTARKVSNWVEIPQVLEPTPNGGGVKYGTVSPLGARNDKKQPIGFEAMGIDLTIGYDATNATIKAMQAITRVFGKVAFKVVIPGGGRVYGYGNLACSEFPRMSKGSAISLSVGIGFDGRAIAYGA